MDRILNMRFASVYPLYLQKVEKKGRTKQELDTVITWLTGYSKPELRRIIKKGITLEQFFADADVNPKASLITGTICGYRVEQITDPLLQKVRYLDKLVDELAKGKSMENILRK